MYFNYSSIKKGYSGVAVISKIEPLHTYYDFSIFNVDKFGEDYNLYNFTKEGRLLTLEFNNFFLVNCYTINSKQKLERLDQRINVWEPIIRKYINKLQEIKPVIFCGDLNVAHLDIDIFNTKGKNKSPGFTKEEREAFGKLLEECSMFDTYRTLYPQKQEYTYFSNFAKSREHNKGWLIDRFVLSKSLYKYVSDSSIHNEYKGSDHCPIMLTLNI